MKLRTRLGALILVTLAPVMGVQLYAQWEQATEQEREALQSAQREAELVANQLDQFTTGYRELLVAVSASQMMQSGSDGRCNAYAEGLQRRFSGAFTLVASDLSGEVYCMGLPFLQGRRINNADRSYFKRVLETGDFVVGEHAFARVPGDAVLHYAYPIFDASAGLKGVLAASVKLQWVAERLARNPLPEGARLTVTDRAGMVVVDLPEGRVSRPAPGRLKELLTQTGGPGAASWIDADGVERIVGYVPAPLAGSGLGVALEMRRESVLAPIRHAALRDTLTLLSAVVLGVLFAAFVARTKLDRPLAMITRAASRWGRGDLAARTGLAGIDDAEFRRLGSTLDEMAERLAAAHEDMRRARDEALKASLSKTHFLAAASHDLRQPLQAMNLNIALLAARHGHGADAAPIERLRRSVTSLGELLNALLDVSQLDAGLVRPNVCSFELQTLLQTVADEFGDIARERQVSLAVAPCHLVARSDPVLLGRMVRNLVSNAIKYTPAGGSVQVACLVGRERVEIVVSDTGQGIPPDKQEEVFEEFRQLGNPQRNPSLGLGLGLAIVRRMSVLLDHPVRLRSRLGTGTTVSVSVPRTHRLDSLAPDLHALQLHGRALLVEDDRLVAESTAELLRAWGLEVSVVHDCDAAFEQLQQEGAGLRLVLADYRLPERCGLDVIERARQACPQALGLILTGDAGDARLLAARELGLQVLEKPVRLERLAQALRPLAEPSAAYSL